MSHYKPLVILEKLLRKGKSLVTLTIFSPQASMHEPERLYAENMMTP